MSKTFKVKLSSAVVVGGVPTRAGSVVEVDETMARRLLDNGKAELATAADVDAGPSDEPGTPDEPGPSGEPTVPDAPETAPAKNNRTKPKAADGAQSNGEAK
ncbi:hypothetical protein [Paracoccus litorisediminis]|uniref:Uncharacterized protein n=1 Tax=Paracoccus litorisediminis TaxID=2006130 RepID=A0A844HNJ4_9RHOB|nr:hypothetical protein [Paracoccus litorisediminis]MTH60659.1 hypothetical protein [Paracoccus litorisediminis]